MVETIDAGAHRYVGAAFVAVDSGAIRVHREPVSYTHLTLPTTPEVRSGVHFRMHCACGRGADD